LNVKETLLMNFNSLISKEHKVDGCDEMFSFILTGTEKRHPSVWSTQEDCNM
jgi:hypothetical protein